MIPACPRSSSHQSAASKSSWLLVVGFAPIWWQGTQCKGIMLEVHTPAQGWLVTGIKKRVMIWAKFPLLFARWILMFALPLQLPHWHDHFSLDDCWCALPGVEATGIWWSWSEYWGKTTCFFTLVINITLDLEVFSLIPLKSLQVAIVFKFDWNSSSSCRDFIAL